MTTEFYCPGLRGVIAGETEISSLDDGVQYRGYSLDDLANGANFLEVAYLLLFDDLPTEQHYADFLGFIGEEQELPPIVAHMYERIPVHNTPLDVLRTGISLLSHYDPQPNEDLLRSGHAQAVRLLARVPLLVGAWHRMRQGLPVLSPLPELSFVANAYYVATGRIPPALYERSLEVALIVAAEHEFNPSTYVARIVGSTRSNQYGPVLAALEAFIGTGHGGGVDSPLDLLDEVGAPEFVPQWTETLDRRTEIPGFGHPVYTECDPRASILEAECDRLARACGRGDLERLAETIEEAVWSRRKLPPNIDWPLARLFAYLELDRDLYRPMFLLARIVGWSAHSVEQCEASEVIRPRARYRGARDCRFEPMRQRCD